MFELLQNFLAKRTNWSESQEPEVVPTAGAAVAYQQQVSLVSLLLASKLRSSEPTLILKFFRIIDHFKSI